MSKLELYSSSDHDSTISKIGYISKIGFIIRNGSTFEFLPCKSFNIADIYGNLSSENLEAGFQEPWNYLNAQDYDKIINSADTFLLKSTKTNRTDTLLIVPAYFGYIEEPDYHQPNDNEMKPLNEYRISFQNKTLRIKILVKSYSIHKVIPLKPYRLKTQKHSNDSIILL